MKKIIMFSLIGLTIIACNSNQKSENSEKVTAQTENSEKIAVQAILPKLISDSEAKELHNHFSKRDATKDLKGKRGYTAAELEAYLIYLKDLAQKNNVELDSIQFELGAYPSNHPKNWKHPKKLSIVLSPVFKSGGTKATLKENTKLEYSNCCYDPQ